MQKSLFLSLFLPLLLSCHSPAVSAQAGHLSSHFCKHSYSITERYSHVHTNDGRLQCSAYHRERTRQPSVPTAFHAALHNMISFSAASLLEETGNISIESLKKKICLERTERGREKSYPLWWINCKGSTCNFLSLLRPWVMDLGLDCPVFQVWGCYTAWPWAEHTNLLTKFFPFQSMEKETKETKPDPNLMGLGFADGKCFTESYNSWETGYLLNHTAMGQRDSAGHRLNLMLIQLLQNTACTLKGSTELLKAGKMESPAGRRGLLGT